MVDEAEKVCSKCKEPKLLAAYSKDPTRPDGLCRQCKPCKRLAYLGRKESKRALTKMVISDAQIKRVVDAGTVVEAPRRARRILTDDQVATRRALHLIGDRRLSEPEPATAAWFGWGRE